MSERQEIQAGGSSARPTDDPYVLQQYAELGLGEAPTLQEIEPHAVHLMKAGKVLEGMGLVLGREVQADDLHRSDLLSQAFSIAILNAAQGYAAMLMVVTSEEVAAEQQAAIDRQANSGSSGINP